MTRDTLSDWDFARRVIIAIALAAAAWVLWRLNHVLVLIFASVLVGVLLSGTGAWIARVTGLRRNRAVLVATLLLLVLIGLFGWMLWGQVGGQIVTVLDALPDTINALAARFGLPFEVDMAQIRSLLALDSLNGTVVNGVARYGLTAFSAAVEVLLVIAGGVFLALDPTLYRRGALLLLPRAQRPRVAEAMSNIGTALGGWFVGQAIIMLAVAAMSAAAYWMIGLPAPLALGIIAGVLNFVPMLGPFLAGAVAVLTAVTVGGSTILWTLVAAIVIQEIESLLLVPRVQQWTVSVPAVVVLFSLVIFGALFGLVGVVLAVPLALTVLVAVQSLWVNEALGEDVEVAGND